MCVAFPRPQYYGGSAPSGPLGRRWTQPLSRHRPCRASHGAGPRRFPCSSVTDQQVRCPALPRQPLPVRRRPSRQAVRPDGLDPDGRHPQTTKARRALQHWPLSTRFEPAPHNEASDTGSSRTPSRLARRTRPIWQYWTVPALSGPLATQPGTSRIRLPSASPGRYDDPATKVSHLRSEQQTPHGAPG